MLYKVFETLEKEKKQINFMLDGEAASTKAVFLAVSGYQCQVLKEKNTSRKLHTCHLCCLKTIRPNVFWILALVPSLSPFYPRRGWTRHKCYQNVLLLNAYF